LVQGHGVAQAAGTLRAHRLQSSDQSWGHRGVGYPSSLKVVKTVREKQAVRNSDCVSPCRMFPCNQKFSHVKRCV
jgi:hypothetical protein